MDIHQDVISHGFVIVPLIENCDVILVCKTKLIVMSKITFIAFILSSANSLR